MISTRYFSPSNPNEPPMSEECNNMVTLQENLIKDYLRDLNTWNTRFASYSEEQKTRDSYINNLQTYKGIQALVEDYRRRNILGAQFVEYMKDIKARFEVLRRSMDLFDAVLAESQSYGSLINQQRARVRGLLSEMDKFNDYMMIDKFKQFNNVLKSGATHLLTVFNEEEIQKVHITDIRILQRKLDDFTLKIDRLGIYFGQLKVVYETTNLHEPIVRLIQVGNDIKQLKDKINKDYGKYIKTLDTPQLELSYPLIFAFNPFHPFRDLRRVLITDQQFIQELDNPNSVYTITRDSIFTDDFEYNGLFVHTRRLDMARTNYAAELAMIRDALIFLDKSKVEIEEWNKLIQSMNTLLTVNIKSTCPYKTTYANYAAEADRNWKEIKNLQFPDKYSNYVNIDYRYPGMDVSVARGRQDPWTFVQTRKYRVKEIHDLYYVVYKTHIDQIKKHFTLFTKVRDLFESLRIAITAKRVEALKVEGLPMTPKIKALDQMLGTLEEIVDGVGDTENIMSFDHLVNINTRAEAAVRALELLRDDLTKGATLKNIGRYETRFSSYKNTLNLLIGNGKSGIIAFIFSRFDGICPDGIIGYVNSLKERAKLLDLKARGIVDYGREGADLETALTEYQTSVVLAEALVNDVYSMAENIGTYINITAVHDSNKLLIDMMRNKIVNNRPLLETEPMYDRFKTLVEQTTAILTVNNAEQMKALISQMEVETDMKRLCVQDINNNPNFNADDKRRATALLAADHTILEVPAEFTKADIEAAYTNRPPDATYNI